MYFSGCFPAVFRGGGRRLSVLAERTEQGDVLAFRADGYAQAAWQSVVPDRSATMIPLSAR